MVTPVKKNERPLPFRPGFLLGILIVFAAKFLSTHFDAPWVLYVGAVIGGALCIVDVFRALTRMN